MRPRQFTQKNAKTQIPVEREEGDFKRGKNLIKEQQKKCTKTVIVLSRVCPNKKNIPFYEGVKAFFFVWSFLTLGGGGRR